MSIIYTCYILYCTYVLFEDVDFFLLSAKLRYTKWCKSPSYTNLKYHNVGIYIYGL